MLIFDVSTIFLLFDVSPFDKKKQQANRGWELKLTTCDLIGIKLVFVVRTLCHPKGKVNSNGKSLQCPINSLILNYQIL